MWPAHTNGIQEATSNSLPSLAPLHPLYVLYIYACSASTGKQPAPVAAAASGTCWYCGPSIGSSSVHYDAHKVSEHESLSPLSSSTEEIYVDPWKYIDKSENHGEDVRPYREKQPAGAILHDRNPLFDKVQGRKKKENVAPNRTRSSCPDLPYGAVRCLGGECTPRYSHRVMKL